MPKSRDPAARPPHGRAAVHGPFKRRQGQRKPDRAADLTRIHETLKESAAEWTTLMSPSQRQFPLSQTATLNAIEPLRRGPSHPARHGQRRPLDDARRELLEGTQGSMTHLALVPPTCLPARRSRTRTVRRDAPVRGATALGVARTVVCEQLRRKRLVYLTRASRARAWPKFYVMEADANCPTGEVLMYSLRIGFCRPICCQHRRH